MPKADTIITVPVQSKPRGFLADLSPLRGDIIENVQVRLDGISSLLFVMKNSEVFDQPTQSAMNAIETMIEDCAALLDVCGPVGVAA